MSRKKAKKWPKIPAEADLLDEETIPECIKTFQIMADTINGPVPEIQIFFQHIESWVHSGKTQTMMAFGTDDMIKSMAAAEMCFVDGTFDTCPHPFVQTFSCNFFVGGNRLVAGLIVLLTQKTKFLYKKVFLWILHKCGVLGLDVPISWAAMMSDLEDAIINAFKEVFPLKRTRGCNFHCCQCIYRKIVEVGLIKEYKDEDSQLQRYARYIFALAFLPQNEVAEGWMWVRYQSSTCFCRK